MELRLTIFAQWMLYIVCIEPLTADSWAVEQSYRGAAVHLRSYAAHR